MRFTKAKNKEVRPYLALKLIEEASEYKSSYELEELADVLEVLQAILKNHGVSFSKLNALRSKKRKERGGFTKNIIASRK